MTSAYACDVMERVIQIKLLIYGTGVIGGLYAVSCIRPLPERTPAPLLLSARYVILAL